MRFRLAVGLVAGAMAVIIPSAGASSSHAKVVLVPTLSLGTSMGSTTHSADLDPSSAGPFCSPVGRTGTDRPDIHDGPLVHVIYLLARGAADDHLDTDGTLSCSIAVQNEWLRKQSQLEWRWDTAIVDTANPADPNARVETLDVTFLQSTQPPSALDDGVGVMAELGARGFKDPNKRYLTYVAAGNDSGVCGDAFYPTTQTIDHGIERYSQVYLDSVEGCGARDFGIPGVGGGLSEAIAQQELMHNDGITPIGAPHSCANAAIPYAHLCTGPLFVLPEVDPEGVDVMFPYVYYPLRDKVLDRGHDDYFRHSLPIAGLEDSPYLQAAGAWGEPVVEPRRSSPAPTPAPSGGEVQPSGRSIELSTGAARVSRGETVELSGRLTADAPCLDDQAVTLSRREPHGRGRPSLHAQTDATGAFSVRVVLKRSTRFIASVAETDSCSAARSRPVTVTVR